MVEGAWNVEPWTARHAPPLPGNFEAGKAPNVRPHAPQLLLYNLSQAACFAPLYDLPRPSRQRDAEPIPTTDSSDLRPLFPHRLSGNRANKITIMKPDTAHGMVRRPQRHQYKLYLASG